jgi:hypothetical protein
MKSRCVRDFNRLNAPTADVRQLFDAMLEIYPDRVNPSSLWGGGEQRQEAGLGSSVTDEIVVAAQRRLLKMRKTLLVFALALTTVSAGSVFAAPATHREPLDAATLNTVRSRFSTLMELANRHDLKALHEMFWQSPSALLVAKSAIPSEGSWAGFWGNEAIDQKLHDIATSGPVVLQPDFSKLKVVGLTHDLAESYAPINITVSYAGQDGTPRPFLMIIDWIKIGKDWRVASEIILPVPPAPAVEH